MGKGIEMTNKALTLGALNKLQPGAKIQDQGGLYWRRNQNNSLTAVQRIAIQGKDKDIRIDLYPGSISRDELEATRLKAFQVKKGSKNLTFSSPTQSNIYYPDMTLSEAWELLLKSIKNTSSPVWNEKTIQASTGYMENHLAASPIWNMKVKDLTFNNVYPVLSTIRAEGSVDIEKKTRSILNKVFINLRQSNAISHNFLSEIPSMYSSIDKGSKAKHQPAITDKDKVIQLYQSIEFSPGDFMVKIALQVQFLTSLRTGEVIGAKWEEINFQTCIWTVPRSRMKMKEDRDYDHEVHISPTLETLLKKLMKIKNPRSSFIFHSAKSETGHISEDTLSKHMRETMGLRDKHVPHGCRASIRTLASNAIAEDGRPLFNREWIEACLDHAEKDKTDQAYKRKPPYDGAKKVWLWFSELITSEVQDND